jgi:hypothetical protein
LNLSCGAEIDSWYMSSGVYHTRHRAVRRPIRLLDLRRAHPGPGRALAGNLPCAAPAILTNGKLNPDLVPGIVKAVCGLRVSGHIPRTASPPASSSPKAPSSSTSTSSSSTSSRARLKTPAPDERFTSVGQYAAGLDLHGNEVDNFIALLESHHATVEGMFTGRPKQVTPEMAPILDCHPAQVQRSAYNGGRPVSRDPAAPSNGQRSKDSYTAMLAMTKRLYDAGISILAGTDDTADSYLHRELELEVQAGIPAPKALQIAKYNAAQLLKKQDLGVIAPGRLADLVLVEGNPAVHFSDIRRCRVVVKNGVLVNSSELYAASGIQPAK